MNTLKEVTAAVDAGKIVHWKSRLYVVHKDWNGEYLVLCTANENCAGLFHRDGIGSEYNAADFYNVGVLHDYATGAEIRPATEQERKESEEAAIRDGGAGVFLIDENGGIVEPWERQASQCLRVYVSE